MEDLFFKLHFLINLLNALFRKRESPCHRAGRRDVANIVRHHHRVLTLQQGHHGLHDLNSEREQELKFFNSPS